MGPLHQKGFEYYFWFLPCLGIILLGCDIWGKFLALFRALLSLICTQVVFFLLHTQNVEMYQGEE